ncbi:PTS galactitol transporter subunit IIC [Vibrio sp. 10N.261.51.F12]|uniref:PTS galactitol transporter subunit IIC n=1 Tax=Vibrio sp. 10N.261.51.F12 TaxID=3229679 RepID=UPI00354F2527
MEFLSSFFEWVIGLGGVVFLPVIIVLIALFFRVPLQKAVMSGITVGIGSVGLGLVITLLASTLGEAIKIMGAKYGTDLTILDIGVGVGGPLAFSTSLGLLLIPVSLLLNTMFVSFGWTKTLNVDIWNFWFPIFLGLMTYAVTGQYYIGVLGCIAGIMLQWLLSDIFQKQISDFYGYPGIAISHLMALAGMVVAVPLNWILDRTPVINKMDADPESLTKKFGIFGDSIFMGLLVGLAVGLLAGYDASQVGNLAISTAAVMKIMPKMVAMFMEGLLPVAEAAKEYTNKKLGGKEVNIGMDAALTVGHPAVMATALLMVPISLLLAVTLPGNKVLPFGDLAFYVFGICLMVPVFKGNLVRSVIGGTIYLAMCLYLSTWLAPEITNVFAIANYDVGTTGVISAVLLGLWPVGLFVLFAVKFGVIGILALITMIFCGLLYVNKFRKTTPIEATI